jgi:hypothetical protein
MSDIETLRVAVIGLVAFAGAEEELLLARGTDSGPDEGSPERWAARPLLAHNAEFRRQQVQRLEAVRRGETPPAFPDIDHGAKEVYDRCCQESRDVAAASRAATLALIDGVRRAADEDLVDPSRNPWLDGKQLWLQVVVRGFWHPTGHLGEYYLINGEPDLAVALQARAVATATFLSAPDAARGMAFYNLACAQGRAGTSSAALEALRQAISFNSQLGPKALGDPDFESLRQDGSLEALVRPA